MRAIITICALAAVIAGCGSDDTSGQPSVLEGRVADGYLRAAKVCVDRNSNNACDESEPSTESQDGGQWSIQVDGGDIGQYPIVVEAIAGITIDEDDGLPIRQDYILATPKEAQSFVSPLTTLVKYEVDSYGKSYQDAKESIRLKAGLSHAANVIEDFVAKKSAGDSDAVKAHALAQAVMKVNQDMAAYLKNDLNVVVSDAEKAAFKAGVYDYVYPMFDADLAANTQTRLQGVTQNLTQELAHDRFSEQVKNEQQRSQFPDYFAETQVIFELPSIVAPLTAQERITDLVITDAFKGIRPVISSKAGVWNGAKAEAVLIPPAQVKLRDGSWVDEVASVFSKKDDEYAYYEFPYLFGITSGQWHLQHTQSGKQYGPFHFTGSDVIRDNGYMAIPFPSVTATMNDVGQFSSIQIDWWLYDHQDQNYKHLPDVAMASFVTPEEGSEFSVFLRANEGGQQQGVFSGRGWSGEFTLEQPQSVANEMHVHMGYRINGIHYQFISPLITE